MDAIGATGMRDMNGDVRYCSPKTDTTQFSLVLYNWSNLRLDTTGNAKAASFMREAGKRRVYDVTIHGALNRRTIKVTSLSHPTLRASR